MTPKVNKHPVAEELAQLLFGIETVPQKEQRRMVHRACKELAKFVDKNYVSRYAYDDQNAENLFYN